MRLAEIVAFLYVCLFLYTGLMKLMTIDLTLEQMAQMPLVGAYAGLMSWGVPFAEIILAVAIFIPFTRLWGLIFGTALMAAFTVYVGILLRVDSTLPCTCGGFLEQLSWAQHLAFNALFTLLGAWTIYFQRVTLHSNKTHNIHHHA